MRGIEPSKTVDEYLGQVPNEHRPTLEKLRELIRLLAPEAAESISYGLPTYKIGGRPLVYFGTAKNHYALYAISGAVRENYSDELSGFSISKGTIRFAYDKPFPSALIKKLVKAQLADRKK